MKIYCPVTLLVCWVSRTFGQSPELNTPHKFIGWKELSYIHTVVHHIIHGVVHLLFAGVAATFMAKKVAFCGS